MKYVRELEGLRGLMALWVVFGHWATTVPFHGAFFRDAAKDEYAVDVFIILSGFAIAALIDKNPEPYFLYLSRRVFRIFPLYLVLLALSILFLPLAHSVMLAAPDSMSKPLRLQVIADTYAYWPYHVATHIFALQSIIPDHLLPSTTTAFLGQAWSLSLEWQFYLIAPFVIAALRGPITAMRAIVLIVASLVLYHLTDSGAFIGQRLHEFIIGIGSFAFMKARNVPGSLVARIPIGKTWVLTVVAFCLAPHLLRLPFLIWLTVIASAISAREHGNSTSTSISRFLNTSLIQWLGKISFSMYLSHMIVLIFVLKYLEPWNYSQTHLWSAILLVGTVGGTIAASYLLYTLVEHPFHQIGRRLGRRSPAG